MARMRLCLVGCHSTRERINMLQDHDIDLLSQAAHGDAFSVLGPHADPEGRLWLRAMLPGAAQVAVLDANNGELLGTLGPRRAEGFFEGMLTLPEGATPAERPNYRLQVRWNDGHSVI